MSESLAIKRIDLAARTPIAEVSTAMDKLSTEITTVQIDKVNWPEQYPAAPKVSLRIAHNGSELFLKYSVHEQYTMALVEQDNGRVWTDSCVEFFVAFDDTGYYNFEFTCIGRALSHFNVPGSGSEHAHAQIVESIGRLSSLGSEPFAERTGDNCWTLTVVIPATAFFKHGIVSLDGIEARANFYKCGDDLSVPHFLSWSPIEFAKPNFHLPAFFGKIKFQ